METLLFEEVPKCDKYLGWRRNLQIVRRFAVGNELSHNGMSTNPQSIRLIDVKIVRRRIQIDRGDRLNRFVVLEIEEI